MYLEVQEMITDKGKEKKAGRDATPFWFLGQEGTGKGRTIFLSFNREGRRTTNQSKKEGRMEGKEGCGATVGEGGGNASNFNREGGAD